ncbi:hypothetical protein TWF102_002637 [Orbilia oligospora]|uniref:PEBP-like protein n=1 Tax=Orbilia oligospora TaxID=2813651 RepID=A0A7C8NSB9_ORBOL|nr:hypothetical protein TWF706_007692 [Orbilia oligospora]KAF3104871.1 hypothetical protein TWF102_002637 [Orbilia oligospora]KAF3116213.1 hypothetical protein TWF103_009437 [Orbilia oligospora]KAF3137915.1 hypothetical protein TWF703_004886 [Orbilia oligospora]KAF3146316.1 hypothetical protein TWF594_003631 [Orbilia oligospora]
MASKYITSLLALAATALSQTPSGFVPKADDWFPVTYDESANPKFFVNGGLFDKSSVQSTPSVYIPDTPSFTGQTFIVLMVDPDAPSPSNNSLGQILHWMQPGVKIPLNTQKVKSPEGKDLLKLDTTSTNAIVPYRGPAPPSQDPHHYIFLLFLQPENTFSLPTEFEKYQGGNDRRRFSAEKFVAAAGLKDPVLGTYFLSGKNTVGDGSQGIQDFSGGNNGDKTKNGTVTSSETGPGATGAPGTPTNNNGTVTFPTPTPTQTKNDAGAMRSSSFGLIGVLAFAILVLS